MANEKRLIDANALKELFEERYDDAFVQERTRLNTQFWNGLCCGVNWGRNTVAYAPTVDAVEVAHGEWTIIDDDYLCLTTLECSVCGEQYCFEEYDEQMSPHYHYCPNCGAKMDGERKDNG